METKTDKTTKKNSNVIYFLIVVIVALLGTDVYLYTKKNKDEDRIVHQSDEKTRLQSELDSLETQIEQVNAGKTNAAPMRRWLRRGPRRAARSMVGRQWQHRRHSNTLGFPKKGDQH